MGGVTGRSKGVGARGPAGARRRPGHGARERRRRRAGRLAVPALLVFATVASGCTGSLARMIVEPSAGSGLFGPGLTEVSGQFAEMRSRVTETLEPDTMRVPGVDGAGIHVLVFEAGDYGFEWEFEWDDDTFRFGFSFENDSVELAGPPETRGTMVLLHGLYMESFQLLPQALYFAERGYRVVLVDLRAHGRSGGRFVSFGVRERKDLAAVVDTLRERGRIEGTLVLYGTSLGGSVALQAAATGVAVDRVVAVSAMAEAREVVAGSGPEMLPGPLRWLVSEDRVEAAVDRAGRLAGFGWDDASTAALAPDVRVPVLLVHGREDDIVPLGHAERLQGALPCSTLLPVERHGHGSLMLDLDATAGSVLPWLEQDQTCAGAADSLPRR